MRSRSSRLFFVLLHLVGVSTIVPSSSSQGHASDDPPRGGAAGSGLLSFFQHLSYRWSHAGIVGVRPEALLLERLDIESSRHGLRGLLDRVERAWNRASRAPYVDLLAEPYWLQDAARGTCLDPNGGFSECGDATLWRVRRRPLSKRELRERRHRRRHREKLEARERGRRRGREEGDGGASRPQEEAAASPVCVWPFFCEHNSKFLQQSSAQIDEIYGYEYENYADQDEAEGFALQLMEVDAATANSSFSPPVSRPKGGAATGSSSRRRFFWNSHQRQPQEGEDDPRAECLSSSPSKNHGRATALHIVPCSSKAAWVWHVNRDGILVHTADKRRRRGGRWGRLSAGSRSKASSVAAAGAGAGDGWMTSDFECAHRESALASASAVLLPCGGGGDGSTLEQAKAAASLVKFSLVRYPSTSSKKGAARRPHRRRGDAKDAEAEPLWEPWTTLERPATTPDSSPKPPAAAAADTNIEREQEAAGSTNSQHLPTSHTSSQHHASAFAKPSPNMLDVKSTASMLHTSVWEHGGAGNKADKDASRTSAAHIARAPVAMDGVAFHNQRMTTGKTQGLDDGPSKGPSSTKLRPNKKTGSTKDKREKKSQTPIHDDPLEPTKGGEHQQHHGPGHPASTPQRPRKIPVHPYIQSSKDFVWVDPLTSLEYPTDLCHYLGHTKTDAGRHTLMGVGQYYRTAFNIKVYGAALYVAKRDVLADPKFGEYAALSAEELQGRADFYEHLMNAPSPAENAEDAAPNSGGRFDRTLFIKINMQLSTDAMRKSLEADWSLLTEEMKSLIINSSFEERMADERMQQTIQAKVNSRNCSCGQSAPPELKADPTCCARGTELAFTWRKNGDFEIRLDGRVMDVYPRPDIAKGLFSEYLNHDPISTDAKAHFADGFPFLLAPLAQVKGMSSAVPPPISKKGKTSPAQGHGHPVHRLMDAAVHSVGAVQTQAHTLTKWMQDGAVGVSSNAIGSAMGMARGLNEELDRQRRELLDNAVALQKEGIEMLASLIKQSTEEALNDGMAVSIVDKVFPSLSPFSNGFDIYNNEDVEHPAMGPLPLQFMPDAIGIKIEPTMNFTHRLFFTTVHIYLLLLFVLSLPGSYTTRRLVIVKRRILETKKFVESQSPFFVR